MKKITTGVGFTNINKYVQRSALFFLALALVFGLAEPGLKTALAVSVKDKSFNYDYRLNPLSSEKQTIDTPLTEQAGEPLSTPRVANPKGRKYEEVKERTAFSSTYVNNDGSRTMEYGTKQQNYSEGNNWKKIDNSLKAKEQKSPEPSIWQKITNTIPEPPKPEEFAGAAGSILVEIKSLNQGVVMKSEGKTITMKPVGAKNSKPIKVSDSSVIYKDAWPGVDIEYELRGEAVKETLILKNGSAKVSYTFSVTGGKIIEHPSRAGELTIEGLSDEYSFSAITVSLQDRGVISEQKVVQSPTKNGDGIAINIDKKWLSELPESSFPVRIDPTYHRVAQTYWMFKSDGYGCNASNCYANIGTLYDNGWKHWRTYFQFPFSNLAGKKILNATLHGFYKGGIGGDTGGRNIWMGHANCVSFHCAGSQVGWAGGVSTDFDINFTNGLQSSINNSDWGTVWSLWGEEGGYKTYKPYVDLVAYVTYDTPTPMAVAASPADKQVTVSTQPSLRVNGVSDADGDVVEYYFRVSTKPDAETGAVINSGWIKAPQWTVPEGILQDGTTYYWHTYTKGALQTNPNWVRSFKVDQRTGKSSTQSYDTVGPVGIDLATGNGSLSDGTHSISALGGDMGLSLSYNTPNQAKKGLKGEYWNISSGYNFNNGAPSSSPKLIRRDQNVDFQWGAGSPASGIQSDNFYARWTGQFVAPKAGTYYFGGNNDDAMRIWIDNVSVYNNSYTAGAIQYGSSVTLKEGQVVPIRVELMEIGGGATAQLYVKGAVPQQIVHGDWLYTDPVNDPQSYGLTGYYYTNPGYADIDVAQKDPTRLMMVRQDTKMNLNFGSDGPAAGLQSDNFMVRWKGYITLPTAGTYTLGASSDNGVRIKLNTGSWQTTLDKWQDVTGTFWGNSTSLPANTPIPIEIDWYERTGSANINLLIQGNGLSAQDIPVTWLTPDASVLPSQWKLGVDVNGSVSYERIRISSNSVVLEDSTGSTHEYTYTNGAYRPPTNEDGTLIKNSDNTYTFTETDGRVYIFDANGHLVSLTAPSDDKKPAALKYTYAGSPSRLVKIEDGTTNTRHGTIFYKGVNDSGDICDPNSAPNSPSTIFGMFAQFDQAPSGKLCAYKTSDGDTTYFYYKEGNLARIVRPGNQITDYGYDSLGRITSVRDPLASDTIGAGIRTDNESVTTQLYYDGLGRISSIKPPSATAGSDRPEHTFDYGINKTDLHVTGKSEPNGYSRRVQYDALYRTVSDVDITGKSTQTEWDSVKDLQYSSTDKTGLKTTIVYDGDDRVVDNYGPAPVAWFGSDRKPLPTYASQVPRMSTAYDQGMKGPAVTWYNLKSANMTLIGAPKAYTTGFSSNNAPESGNPAYLRHDFRAQALPFSVDSGFEGYGFTATGKLRFTQGGTYTFTAATDDSVKLLINDQQILSNWGTKTAGDTRNTLTGSISITAGKVYRFTYQYGHDGMSDLGSMGLDISGPGISGSTRDWSAFLQPGYNLPTSATVYDNILGNIINTTQYSNPAYGLISGTTLDPGGLNHVAQATYEVPGTNYLRQVSKTLPGGSTTTYQHYGGGDTRDNPCTPENETYHQAGRPKGRIEPTGRTSESIYDESGNIVATRYNNEPWTCISYDSRGRVTSTIVPSINGKASRTVTNNYAVGGNPLITSSSDSNGVITTEIDLLGHTVKYTDSRGNATSNTYDGLGKLLKRTSGVGVEEYEYDHYDRLIRQKLDDITLSAITYDEFSRIDRVLYPGNMSLQPAIRDSLGGVSKVTYRINDQDITDEIVRSTSGLVMSGVENGVNKTYTYDKADRLIGATIGNNTFAYGFGTPHSSCSGLPGNNPNTSKSSNRTSYTLNGQATTYCYNMGDQLISSSDPRFSQVNYDSRGNTVRLGDDSHKTEFTYDVSDRNVGIKEETGSSSRETLYERDVTNRIYHRTYKINGVENSNFYYGFTDSGDSAGFLQDANGTIVQKYLNLVGGVKVTLRPQSTSASAATYTLSNIQGNAMATVDADGTTTIIVPSGPFGESLSGHSSPQNSASGTSSDYLSIHRKSTESEYLIKPIQMGGRVYIPELGRFLQIDPADGGTLNGYVYALDPINQVDANGNWIQVILAVIAIVSIVMAAKSVHTAVKNPTPTNITVAVIDTAGAAGAVFTGGGSVVASRTAGAAARGAASASARKAAQIATNKAAGKEAERVALEKAKAQYAKEYELRTQQYFKVDGFDRGRFADITAYRNNQPVFNIEVKSGNAKYGGLQAAKDQAILDQYGVPTYLERIMITGK